MGADIHMYLEYRPKVKKDDWDKKWHNFTYGQVGASRNYGMFEILAGVRGSFALFQPKGMVKDPASTTFDENTLYISKDGDTEGTTTLERAQQWVAHGCEIIKDKEGKPWRVTHPDWHSHSWLTSTEYSKALREYKKRYEHNPIEYTVLLALMRHYERNGFETRLVFWFDN